jgi:hypothetical protein
MKNKLEKILSNADKTLDDVSESLKMDPNDILEAIIQKQRFSSEPLPVTPTKKPSKSSASSEDGRTDDQLSEYFLNRLKKESLSVTALNNKYKVRNKERVERILEKLVDEEKITKRESRNKKGRYVYEGIQKNKKKKPKKKKKK